MTTTSQTPSLGHALRKLRTERQWTLREMSQCLDIPLSTLSKVENGQLTLGYDRLAQLCERLGIGVFELFSPTEPAQMPAAVTARRSISHAGDAVAVRTRTYEHRFLNHDLRRKAMVPTVTEVLARNIEEFGPLARHAGEEWFYVLSGRVEVHCEFYAPIVLGVGESLYIDANMGHGYVLAPGCESATVLGVCTDPNVFAYVSAKSTATTAFDDADG